MLPLHPKFAFDLAEVDKNVPVLLQGEQEVHTLDAAAEKTIEFFEDCKSKSPLLKDYVRVEKLKLTTHRLLVQAPAVAGRVARSAGAVVPATAVDGGSAVGSAAGAAGASAALDVGWLCVRLDKIREVVFDGSGIFRNKRVLLKYVAGGAVAGNAWAAPSGSSPPVQLSPTPPKSLYEKAAGAGSPHDPFYSSGSSEDSSNPPSARAAPVPVQQRREQLRATEILFKLSDNALVERLYKLIKKAVADRGWAGPGCSFDKRVVMGGIAAVQNRADQKAKQDAAAADDGMKDLSSLKKNAEVLVGLAKRVAKSNTEEDNEIKKLLKEYGLLEAATAQEDDSASPTTTTGASFTDPLASELHPVCLKALRSSKIGMMLVHDFYCLFNRLRGTAIVSPKELSTALREIVSRENSALSLRSLPNGASCLQLTTTTPEAMAEDLVKLISEERGGEPVSAQILSEAWSISVGLAAMHLKEIEMLGTCPICRDDSKEGLMFYKNVFV